MEIRGQDNRGRAAENSKEKTRVLPLVFQQVVASHVEDDFKPLTAPTFVNIFLLFPVGVAVLVYPFHLGRTSAPWTLNAMVIHLCLPLFSNLLCCFHSLSPLLNFCRLYFLPLLSWILSPVPLYDTLHTSDKSHSKDRPKWQKADMLWSST